MRYCVCFLFSRDGKQVLLQKKDRTSFAGKWNGVGGKARPHEPMLKCALREIYEETGANLRNADLTWLGDLTLPEDCTGRLGRAELSFYSARVDKDAVSMQPGETEELAFFDVGHFDGTGEPFPYETAGAGDAEYFIRRAIGAMQDT